MPPVDEKVEEAANEVVNEKRAANKRKREETKKNYKAIHSSTMSIGPKRAKHTRGQSVDWHPR